MFDTIFFKIIGALFWVVLCLVGLFFHFLPRCIDVFIVSYILGFNGIKGRKAALVCLSFGLSVFLMETLAYHLADVRDYDGLIYCIGLLPALSSLLFLGWVSENRKLSFNIEKIILLPIISLFTALDVFAIYQLNGTCLAKSGWGEFLAIDVILAILVGCYGIYRGKKQLMPTESDKCAIGIAALFNLGGILVAVMSRQYCNIS